MIEENKDEVISDSEQERGLADAVILDDASHDDDEDNQVAEELHRRMKKRKKRQHVSDESSLQSPQMQKKDKVSEAPNPGNRFGDMRGKTTEVRGQVKYTALRQLLRSELKQGRVMDRSRETFAYYKQAFPGSFTKDIDAKVYSSVVNNVREQWVKKQDEYVSPDYVHKANPANRRPQNFLHQSKTLRELGALLLEWMDEDGHCNRKSAYDLCRLLTIANKYGDQRASEALEYSLTVYKEARVGNWMGEFTLRDDGTVWPGPRYRAITVTWASKYNILLQTCSENRKGVLASENLATQIIEMTNKLDCDDIIAAEPNANFVGVLNSLIRKEGFQGVATWHEKLCVLFLHHGAGIEHIVKLLRNCECKPKGHNGDAKNVVCKKHPCPTELHHYCCFGVTQALMAFRINIPTINLMLSHPGVFLTANTIAALAYHKSHCLYMMRFFEVLNLQDQLDIGEHMIAIQTELDDRREYWSILCKHKDKFHGEPPSIVVEFIRAEAWKEQKDFVQKINAGNFAEASKKNAELVKYGCKFDPEELKAMEVECEKQAGAKMCLDTYNAVLKVLKDCAAKYPNSLQAYPVQALCATLVLSDLMAGKEQTFLQLDPGCGKTFIICLLLKCLQKLPALKLLFPHVYIVVPTDWLKTVLLKVADKFDFNPMPNVLMPHEIEAQILTQSLWIVDEFPHMIQDAKCMFASETCKLRGQLKLGLTKEHSVIMMGGFAKKRFMDFFADAYPLAGKHIMGRSGDFTHAGEPEKTTFKVECLPDPKSILKKLYARVNKVFVDSPRNAIIFGHRHEPGGDYEFDVCAKVIYIDSVDQAEKFVRSCTNMRRHVICVSPDFGLGLDMKFTVDAKCFVVWPKDEPEDAEFMKQMLSRGARGGSLELGTVYMHGNPDESQATEDRLREDEGIQFFEGGKILRAVANLATKTNNDPVILKSLAGILGADWKMSRNDYAQ